MLEHFDAADPEPRGLVLFLGDGLIVASQVVDVLVVWLFPVAMVGFVVDDDDIFEAHEFFGHTADHLAFGFLGRNRGVTPLEQ